MLDSQVVVNLFPQVCVRIELVTHGQLLVGYLGATAIAWATRVIGQTATSTMIPKATSSDK
jgi:hypothetical protein